MSGPICGKACTWWEPFSLIMDWWVPVQSPMPGDHTLWCVWDRPGSRLTSRCPMLFNVCPKQGAQSCHPIVRASKCKCQDASTLSPAGKVTQETFLGHQGFCCTSPRCLWKQRHRENLQKYCALDMAVHTVPRWTCREAEGLHYSWSALKVSTLLMVPTGPKGSSILVGARLSRGSGSPAAGCPHISKGSCFPLQQAVG